jgi:lipid-A-disaccharide synthase
VKYYIIAGERSGDLHGGNLVRAIRDRDGRAVIRGFGGDDMKNAGVTLAVHYRELAFMGFLSLAGSLLKIYRYISYCKSDLLAFAPDVLILIDYGGFNLQMAVFAKKKGIPVIYYIPPKVWAWYQSRALKLKANVDRMLVILPFEKEFYRQYDFEVHYVGNPVLDAIRAFQPDGEFLQKNQLNKNDRLVALLPGSRKIELKRIVPLMAEVVNAFTQVQFVVAAVSNLPAELYKPLAGLPNVKFIEGQTYDLLFHAKAAIVTSGTATLETALFKVPQAVVYKTGGLEYLIASSLVNVQFISLVNLISGRLAVKEFIQKNAVAGKLIPELDALLNDQSYREEIKDAYEKLYRLLDTGSASANAARLINEFLAESKKLKLL